MTVEKFFDEWHAKWGISIGSGPRKFAVASNRDDSESLT